MKLDRFDLDILRLLQRSTRLTSEAIGAEVGLSATACQRRIKRLRESGAIAREVAVLDPRRVGGRITLLVQIELERGGAHRIDDFKRSMRQIPEVQQCYYVTGADDFVILVSAPDMAAYEALTRRIFYDNPNVRKFHTTVVMECVKAGLEIPL